MNNVVKLDASLASPVVPLLTIAIPTWNRASYLALTLNQIQAEMEAVARGAVEVLVTDNASPDETRVVVESAILSGLPVRYIRNQENIGSDANIAQCFNLAAGRYVLILGDDDLFVDGGLKVLLSHLGATRYGVICLRPYGYDHDFRKEYPGSFGNERIFSKPGNFLAKIGPLVTLISSCVINKELLQGIDANQFCGGNLVQVHLVIRASLAAESNLFLNRYLIACKRNNSGGYDFSQVFVTNLGRILDQYKLAGLADQDVRAFERRMILSYYPFYILRQRLTCSGDLSKTFERFQQRFNGQGLFEWWLKPALLWSRPFALVWGAVITVVGRIAGGDLGRGVAFAANQLFRWIGLSK